MTSNRENLPKWSANGLSALDVFFRDYNEVSFFVEDEDQENLYFEIFRRLFPNVSFDRIIPLGGKPAVLAHAKKPENAEIKNRVYILDKDFDDLLGKTEDIKDVYYLDRFCIENYLMEEDAITEVVVESRPKAKRSEIAKTLDLQSYFDETNGQLKHLFSLFFLAQLEGLEIENCRSKPEKYCDPRAPWKLLDSRIDNYLEAINDQCKQRACGELVDFSEDHRLEHFHKCSLHEVVSGKFWLNLLFHYVKSHYSQGSITFESFVYRLAKNCTLQSLDPLREVIEDSIE